MVTCTDMLFQCCSSLKVQTGTYVLFSSSGVASEALSTVQYYIFRHRSCARSVKNTRFKHKVVVGLLNHVIEIWTCALFIVTRNRDVPSTGPPMSWSSGTSSEHAYLQTWEYSNACIGKPSEIETGTGRDETCTRARRKHSIDRVSPRRGACRRACRRRAARRRRS
jgi:hypothetical protein